MKATNYLAHTIIDADNGERFVSEDFLGEDSADRAQRRRDGLSLTYGKQFRLRVAEIYEQGQLHKIEIEDGQS